MGGSPTPRHCWEMTRHPRSRDGCRSTSACGKPTGSNGKSASATRSTWLGSWATATSSSWRWPTSERPSSTMTAPLKAWRCWMKPWPQLLAERSTTSARCRRSSVSSSPPASTRTTCHEPTSGSVSVRQSRPDVISRRSRRSAEPTSAVSSPTQGDGPKPTRPSPNPCASGRWATAPSVAAHSSGSLICGCGKDATRRPSSCSRASAVTLTPPVPSPPSNSREARPTGSPHARAGFG